MTLPASLAPFAAAPFRRYFAGRVVSVLGNAVAPIALAFAVLDLTGKASDLGLVLAARSIPMAVFLLFGGVIADRLPRQRVVMWASLGSAASQAVAALLVLSGGAQVWHLMAVEAVNGTASAFIFPALWAMVTQLVPRAQLQQANALAGMARNGAIIGGAALGGVLVAALGPGWGLAVDALAFAVGASLFAGLRVATAGPGDAEKSSVLWDLRAGWSEFLARTWLWIVVAAFFALNAIHAGAINTVGPVVADATIGRASWGVVLAMEAVGMVLGGAVMLRVRPRRPIRAGMLGMLAELPLIAALGFVSHLPTLIVLGILAGAGMAVFGVTWDTTVQAHVPADKLSRVSSYDALGSFAAVPAGQVAAGFLAEGWGTRPVLVGAAACYLAVIAAALVPRAVRTLGRGDAVPAGTASAAPADT